MTDPKPESIAFVDQLLYSLGKDRLSEPKTYDEAKSDIDELLARLDTSRSPLVLTLRHADVTDSNYNDGKSGLHHILYLEESKRTKDGKILGHAIDREVVAIPGSEPPKATEHHFSTQCRNRKTGKSERIFVKRFDVLGALGEIFGRINDIEAANDEEVVVLNIDNYFKRFRLPNQAPLDLKVGNYSTKGKFMIHGKELPYSFMKLSLMHEPKDYLQLLDIDTDLAR